MNEVYNQKWRTARFGDECKQWLLLLLRLVDYDHNPETFLREFFLSQHYTVSKNHKEFIIDQVSIGVLHFLNQMVPKKYCQF